VYRHKAALGLFAILIYTNGIASNYKASRQTAVTRAIEQYRHFPSWMHTDPVQIIGIPAQVAPTFVPHRGVIEKAWRKYKSRWHPDHWRPNNFTDQVIAYAVYYRGEKAMNALLRWHEDPKCDHFWTRLANFDGNSTQSLLPTFAKDCACTWPSYIRKELSSFLVLVDWQVEPPQKLEDACPCNADIARKSWSSFSFALRASPPYLSRIKQQLPWKTPDWRVWLYRLQGLLRHEDFITEDDGVAKACSNGTSTRCEHMDGWTSFRDFDFWTRPCRIYWPDWILENFGPDFLNPTSDQTSDSIPDETDNVHNTDFEIAKPLHKPGQDRGEACASGAGVLKGYNEDGEEVWHCFE
jgi:hypothetical protein